MAPKPLCVKLVNILYYQNRLYWLYVFLLIGVVIFVLIKNTVNAEMIQIYSENLKGLINYTQPISQEVNKKDYFVWFEINTKRYLDKYIKHVEAWVFIGKPMVTARIHNVESFTKQLINANIPVVSGFKTSDVFKDRPFEDIDAWAEIARVARNVSGLTNGRAVILENEGTVKSMLTKGVNSINYEQLLKSISAQQWPEIWFWYAPEGRREPVQTMSNDIARAIMNGIPHARLIEASSAGFATSPANFISKNNLKRTFALDHNPISIIYLDDVEKNFWKLHNTDQAVKAAVGNTVIIYPGFGDIGKSQAVKESLSIQISSQKNKNQ